MKIIISALCIIILFFSGVTSAQFIYYPAQVDSHQEVDYTLSHTMKNTNRQIGLPMN